MDTPEDPLSDEDAIAEVEKLFGPWQEIDDRANTGIVWLMLVGQVANIRTDTFEWNVIGPAKGGSGPQINGVCLEEGICGGLGRKHVLGMASRCVLKHVRRGNLTPTLPATT